MWAQEWNNIYSWTAPYDGVPSVDVTENMQKNPNFNESEKIWRAAEEFYTSIGLPKMTDSFWKLSQIVRPSDPNIQVRVMVFLSSSFSSKVIASWKTQR